MMKRKYIGLLGVLLCIFTACSEKDILGYDAATRSLYVPWDGDKDSIQISFQHFQNVDDYEVRMPVCLAGDYLPEARKFRMEIDEKLTTAHPDDYTLELEQTFRAGVLVDSVFVVLHRTEHLASEKVRLAIRLVPNETFGVAEYMGNPDYTSVYKASTLIRIVFSDLISKPDWWDQRVTDFILGKYSDEKYRRFIESSGRVTLDGCSSGEIRKIMQKFRDDIRINDWREEDGSSMEIVMN